MNVVRVPLNPVSRVLALLDAADALIVRANGVLAGLETRDAELRHVIRKAAQLERRVEDAIDAHEPLLHGMHSVAPDLTELLAVSKGLNELMGSVPGLGKAKRRVDDELERRAED